MIDLEFIKELKTLDILAKKKVISSYAGERKSIRQGRGLEPIDHREYFPGDDLRFVDWNVYGRTEKLFIKRFEEDKSLTTHLLLDSSESMDFASGKETKFTYASKLAIGFCYLVTKENEKFGMGIFSDCIKTTLHDGRGKRQLHKAISLLNAEKTGGITNLRTASNQYTKLITTRSLTVLISDFLEPIEGIRDGIFHLAKKSRNFIVIHVADPMEKHMELAGDIRLEDLESGEKKKLYFSPKIRNKYEFRYMAHIEKVRAITESAGADFFSVTTDMPVFEVFFEIGNKTRRGGR